MGDDVDPYSQLDDALPQGFDPLFVVEKRLIALLPYIVAIGRDVLIDVKERGEDPEQWCEIQFGPDCVELCEITTPSVYLWGARILRPEVWSSTKIGLYRFADPDHAAAFKLRWL